LSVDARLQWLARRWHCPPDAPDTPPPMPMTPAEQDCDKKQHDALTLCDERHISRTKIAEIGEKARDRAFADRFRHVTRQQVATGATRFALFREHLAMIVEVLEDFADALDPDGVVAPAGAELARLYPDVSLEELPSGPFTRLTPLSPLGPAWEQFGIVEPVDYGKQLRAVVGFLRASLPVLLAVSRVVPPPTAKTGPGGYKGKHAGRPGRKGPRQRAYAALRRLGVPYTACGLLLQAWGLSPPDWSRRSLSRR
jgi:hypothetical protein